VLASSQSAQAGTDAHCASDAKLASWHTNTGQPERPKGFKRRSAQGAFSNQLGQLTHAGQHKLASFNYLG